MELLKNIIFIFDGITIFLFLIFLLCHTINPTKLWAAFFFTVFFFTFAGTLIMHIVLSVNLVLWVLLVLLFVLAVPLFLFGGYILIALLFWNSRVVLKRERRSLANYLTFIAGCILLISALSPWLIVVLQPSPRWLTVLIISFNTVLGYYIFHVLMFLIGTWLCNLSFHHKNKQYIIVHGCGLRKDGSVSPLLAARVDKAISFYEKQAKKTTPPKLILSGGKGMDEIRSEAEAMAEYAREKGIPPCDLILESASATTLENIRFSKEIMDKDAGGKRYRCIYVTSNYHVLRTGIYARRQKMRMRGLGARTALYYLPNALLREYSAYLMIYRKWNIVLGVQLFFMGILAGLAVTM